MPAPVNLEQHLLKSPLVERAREITNKRTEATPKGEFVERLAEFIGQTDDSHRDAMQKVEALAEGRSHDLHGTMIAMEEANIQLRLLGTVRNKAIEVYREIMRLGA
ncbi:MAG: flagellar hook-basal body complex protein FliE [Myxococcales bacterium]|nr:flagellar hook-basal body complex protein FliE [Myxococcales bacterium]MDD9968311.1 flagellar hook-basal body complex protein FliE [Myxococcales bacterium]